MSILSDFIARVRSGRRPALRARAAILTDTGRVRGHNEDAALYVNRSGTSTLSGRGALAIVADGMGGHLGGEVASHIAVEIISRRYFELRGAVPRALQQSIEEANRAIHAEAEGRVELSGMGTTCVVLALRDRRAWGAHVGDSRAYLVRDGRIDALTDDHSMVNDLLERGLIDAEQARNHTDKNVILRALGTRPEVDVSLWRKPLRLEPGDRFVLSSDGLHDLVTDEEILGLAGKGEPGDAAGALIELANLRGGHDNVTVGIIEIDGAGGGRREVPDTRVHEIPAVPRTRVG